MTFKLNLSPRLELCSEANPELWSLFCFWKKRKFGPSYVWTVKDVLNMFGGNKQSNQIRMTAEEREMARMFDMSDENYAKAKLAIEQETFWDNMWSRSPEAKAYEIALEKKRARDRAYKARKRAAKQ
jgi:predicted DNA-binding protein (UPF0251 family)